MWKNEKFIIDDIYFSTNDKHKYIFDKLCAFDLAKSTQKRIARFILFLCELWCGLDISTALKKLNGEKPPEIEHIFPANPEKKYASYKNKKPDHISKLENVCLLEAGINKKVGNNMLIQNDKNGKLELYKESDFIMPNMFYVGENKDMNTAFVNDKGYYGKDEAQKRIETIIETIKKAFFNKNNGNGISFGGMLKEVSPAPNSNSSQND